MASLSDLELAERLVTQLNCRQSQGALTSQANDVWPIVQALGYYDLADFLKRLATPPPAWCGRGDCSEWAFGRQCDHKAPEVVRA